MPRSKKQSFVWRVKRDASWLKDVERMYIALIPPLKQIVNGYLVETEDSFVVFLKNCCSYTFIHPWNLNRYYIELPSKGSLCLVMMLDFNTHTRVWCYHLAGVTWGSYPSAIQLLAKLSEDESRIFPKTLRKPFRKWLTFLGYPLEIVV